MKLIFEMTLGAPYLYRASEKHYLRIKDQLPKRKISPKQLDEECWLEKYGNNFHIVFNLKKKGKKK